MSATNGAGASEWDAGHPAGRPPLAEGLGGLLPLVADLHDAVLILDATGSCVFANLAFERLIGRPGATASVDGVSAWIDELSRERWSAMVELARTRNGQALDHVTFAVDLVTLEGARPAELAWSSAYSDSGDLLGVLVIVRPADRVALPGDEELLVQRLRRLEEELGEPFSGNGAAGRQPNEPVAPFEDRRLSRRENQVAQQLLAGARPPEIATALFLSEHTVRNHVKRIYRKLGVHSAAELRQALLRS